MYEWESDLAARKKEFQELDAKRQAELEAKDYDGIVGLPPAWVPDPVLESFREMRDFMLKEWGYTREQSVEWINKAPQLGKEIKDWYEPYKSPSGRVLDIPSFHRVIRYLADLRLAISIGPEEGLKMLSGDDAVRGYKTISSASEGGKAKGTIFSQEKIDVLRVAGQIIEQRSREPSKRELARLVVREVYQI